MAQGGSRTRLCGTTCSFFSATTIKSIRSLWKNSLRSFASTRFADCALFGSVVAVQYC